MNTARRRLNVNVNVKNQANAVSPSYSDTSCDCGGFIILDESSDQLITLPQIGKLSTLLKLKVKN